jgi:hypothetical protein
MALAALGAVAVLDVGSRAAEAAPSVSPFVGSYFGYVPGSDAAMPVTISDAGRISGASNSGVTVSGRVSADGSYSLTASGTVFWYDEWRDRIERHTFNATSNGIMALDVDGNIVGTSNRDTSGFVWLRQ